MGRKKRRRLRQDQVICLLEQLAAHGKCEVPGTGVFGLVLYQDVHSNIACVLDNAAHHQGLSATTGQDFVVFRLLIPTSAAVPPIAVRRRQRRRQPMLDVETAPDDADALREFFGVGWNGKAMMQVFCIHEDKALRLATPWPLDDTSLDSARNSLQESIKLCRNAVEGVSPGFRADGKRTIGVVEQAVFEEMSRRSVSGFASWLKKGIGWKSLF